MANSEIRLDINPDYWIQLKGESITPKQIKQNDQVAREIEADADMYTQAVAILNISNMEVRGVSYQDPTGSVVVITPKFLATTRIENDEYYIDEIFPRIPVEDIS